MADLRPIKTPCIGVCSTGIGDSVCRGCKRFAHEVIDWNTYTEEQKRIIDDRLSNFLAICVANRFRVMDPKLLAWQLRVQNIRHHQQHDKYCNLFALLKAGAKQIKLPEQFGFEVLPYYRGESLSDLRDQIDEQFWTLSLAHHERYIATPDLFTEL